MTGEIIDVARQHLPGTFIMSVEAAEAAWDKVRLLAICQMPMPWWTQSGCVLLLQH